MWLSKSIFFVDLLFTDKKKQKTKQNVILVLYSYYVGGKLKMVYFMIAVEHFNHTDKRLWNWDLMIESIRRRYVSSLMVRTMPAKASVPLAARGKCIFPMGCQVVFGSRWLLLGEVGCKEGAAPKTPLCLTASRLPQSPVVCMDDTDLSANTC